MRRDVRARVLADRDRKHKGLAVCLLLRDAYVEAILVIS
jgi:hypothetical protein